MPELSCFGQYGFGTGAGQDCNVCPERGPCWEEHRRRVDADHPEEVAEFQRMVERLAPRFGDRARQMVGIALAASGRLDPYTQAIVANVQRGQLARSVPRN